MQTFFLGIPGVNYTVIMNGEWKDNSTGELVEYSVEYDCGGFFGLINYCIHFLARKPTMPAPLLNSLVSRAEAMGLNTQNLPLTMTKQDGCWN